MKGFQYNGSGWSDDSEFTLSATDPYTHEVVRVALDRHRAGHLRDRLSRFLEGKPEGEPKPDTKPPAVGGLQQAMTDF